MRRSSDTPPPTPLWSGHSPPLGTEGVGDVKSTEFAVRQSRFAAGAAILPLMHM